MGNTHYRNSGTLKDSSLQIIKHQTVVSTTETSSKMLLTLCQKNEI